MAKSKYKDYTVEELVNNQEFVETIKSFRTKKDWQQFLEIHSESKENILQAKRIVSLFNVDEGKLEDERKYKLWREIRNFDKEFSRKGNIIRLRRISGIAASILIIISLGSLLFLATQQNKVHYQFAGARSESESNNPVLVLSNGETIELEKSDSKITVLNGENAVQINDDRIVKYESATVASNRKAQFNEVTVPYGEKIQLELNDGTKVWLNAGSRFAFPQKFEGKKRTVFLDGEGYFEVRKDKEHPFMVSLNNINIEVLGTKFMVSDYGSDELCQTVLLEGSVNVWGTNTFIADKMQMNPNQKAVYDIAKKEMELKSEPNAENYVSWIEGWYQFSNVDLEEVFTKLERYYNVSVKYDKQQISKTLPVSGKLDIKNSLEETMSALSGVAKIKFEIKGNNIIISK